MNRLIFGKTIIDEEAIVAMHYEPSEAYRMGVVTFMLSSGHSVTVMQDEEDNGFEKALLYFSTGATVTQ